jgi:hypothetical protein
MIILHEGYRQVNGKLAGREPAYLYASGLTLLATWAPALKPTDSPDPRLSELIAEGDQFQLNNIWLRSSQLYSPGYLVARWTQIEPNAANSNQVAQQTALHALLQRPTGIATLGAKTFLGYWDFSQIHIQATADLGIGRDLPKELTSNLTAYFRLSPARAEDVKPYTLLQRYHLDAQPYYYVVLLSPFVCGGLIFLVSEGYVFLLFLHSWVLFGTATLLSVTPNVRYLQPMSLLTILIFAGLAKVVTDRRSHRTSTLTP